MLFWSSCGRRMLALAGLGLACLITLLGCGSGREASLLDGRLPSSITHARHAERLTDGVRALTGDVWNSDLVSVLELGASVEWDLGAIRAISAAYVEADHDDVYALLVSDDGRTFR